MVAFSGAPADYPRKSEIENKDRDITVAGRWSSGSCFYENQIYGQKVEVYCNEMSIYVACEDAMREFLTGLE